MTAKKRFHEFLIQDISVDATCGCLGCALRPTRVQATQPPAAIQRLLILNHPLALLLAVAFSVHIATMGSRTAIPLIAIQSGATPVTVGVLLSLFSAIPLLLSIPAGRLVDR